jgi:hypothetical protein
MIFDGKDREGKKFGRQGFRNTLTGQMVAPEEGWDGEPPEKDHGDLACVISASEKYRQNYDKINWERPCSESANLQKGN